MRSIDLRCGVHADIEAEDFLKALK